MRVGLQWMRFVWASPYTLLGYTALINAPGCASFQVAAQGAASNDGRTGMEAREVGRRAVRLDWLIRSAPSARRSNHAEEAAGVGSRDGE